MNDEADKALATRDRSAHLNRELGLVLGYRRSFWYRVGLGAYVTASLAMEPVPVLGL